MIFAENLGIPEGPVLLDDGTFLIVEMRPDRGCVSRLSADGNVVSVLIRTGRPNGLAVDTAGRIWVAESGEPSVIVLDVTGKEIQRIRGPESRPFLFPNDLAFGPDGKLYFTDSGILFEDFAPGGSVREDWRTVPTDGRCYRVDPESLQLDLVDDGLRFPNGIAFDAAGDLYVNETLTGDIVRYRMADDYSARELFGNVWKSTEFDSIRGPDGMKFASNGDLYVTVFGQGDVTVLDATGAVVNRIRTHGSAPTNLVFGRDGDDTIFVTEDAVGTLERHHVGVSGLPLHMGVGT